MLVVGLCAAWGAARRAGGCTAPNTRLLPRGGCECRPGFFGSNPNGQGCWLCNQTCHPLASCVRTPACECFFGYRGDGVESCELSTPVLTNLALFRGAVDGECLVNATFSNTERIAGTGYCKFGQILVQAESVENGVVQCRLPEIDGGSTMVSISFDGVHFSAPLLKLRIRGSIGMASPLRLILVGAVAFGAAIALWKRSRRFERVPRNRDHELLVKRSEIGIVERDSV
jgi:hypothetical protein